MYFNKYNNFYHGIMFHHFHDGKNYLKSDGSIDRDDFYKLSGFQHLNRLIGETKKKIDDYPSKIKKDKEWLKELENQLEELEIVEKHLEVV